MLRLNDWVTLIPEQSCSKLIDIIPNISKEDTTDLIPYITRLLFCGRTIKEEEPEAHEEFDPYIQEHTEELEKLKLYQPRQFADALKAIFVTPLKKEISEQSDNFEYVEPVYELIEAEEFQNPAWIAEMEEKDPDKLFNFFMQADLSIIDELDSKQYEVESFEELVAYHDELMSQPDRQQKSDEAANEILGKPKKYSDKKLRKVFIKEISQSYDLKKKELDDAVNLRQVLNIQTDDDLHVFRSNIHASLRIKTTTEHWKDVITVGDAIVKLQYLNKNKDEQEYEKVPASATQLQMSNMQDMMDQQMGDLNKMMGDLMDEVMEDIEDIKEL